MVATTATATKTSLKKGGRAVSNFIALMRSRSIREMLANSSGPGCSNLGQRYQPDKNLSSG